MTSADINPFIYSHPLAPDDIIDRDEECDKLLRHARGSHYVRLYAPRKYGKTSLLTRVLRDGEKNEKIIPLYVDLYRISSIADVTVRIERAYSSELKGPIKQRVEEFLQNTGLGLSLGPLGISAKLQGSPTTDLMPTLHALLDLPLQLGRKDGHRALIVLDEFQDIDKILGLDGLIRSHIQHHGTVASYVFAGSEPGLMKQLFENKERPLYGSAVPMRLGRLLDVDIIKYISERFQQTNKKVGEALAPLLASAKGHPQRTMFLSHHLWEEVPKTGSGTLRHWSVAHSAALEELEPEFDAQWRSYDTTEQKTMRAIVASGGSPYTASVLKRLDLTTDGIKWALPRLEATADIEKDNQRRKIIDPLLGEWIEQINR